MDSSVNRFSAITKLRSSCYGAHMYVSCFVTFSKDVPF